MVFKMLLFKFCLFLGLLFYTIGMHGQDKIPSTIQVSMTVNDMPFNKVLTLVEQQTPYKFAYNTELIARQKNISINVHYKPLNEFIAMVLKGTNISFNVIDNQIVLEELMHAARITICGYVRDSVSGEFLPGVVIYLPENKSGTYTNNYGFYSITLNASDSMKLWISYLGFNSVYTNIATHTSFFKNFYLTESKIQLESILIHKDNANDNVKKHMLGKTDISDEMIKTVPTINGKGDIMNTIQMLPGVMAGLDGRPGYFIRGGNTDQNLVQLDEAALYNPSHFLGLISIFNSSAIKSATLLKGGFPASFGDHLSSVLDVTMKDGNDTKSGGDLQLGTITSGFTFSGPLKTKNASYFVSARRSTVDFLLKPFHFSKYYSNYYFYDVNAKVNLKISPRDRLYISFYQGKDKSSYAKDSTANNTINYNVRYGNQAIAVRWNHLITPKLFSNTSVIYNNYYHDLTASQMQYYAELYSGIRDLNFKMDFNYYPNTSHIIATGISYLYQTLYPSSVSDRTLTTESIIPVDPSKIPRKYASRFAVYFSDQIILGSKLSAYIGGRVPLCFTQNTHYLQFEPRLALIYLITSSSSIKVSYTEMHQYLHLVQSYNAAFPAEIWIGSSKIVKPQNCRQASIGLFKIFSDNAYQTSLEFYYKHLGNQLLFRGGLSPTIDNDIENKLIFGKGESYGTELLIKKNKGSLTGWLGYTLSFANQQFDSLNMGKQFPFANDRRHSLDLSVSYSLSGHWVVSSNFILTSGRAFTLFKNTSSNPALPYYNPLYYNFGAKSGTAMPSLQTEQNNFRLAPYNRLDLSISYRNIGILWNRTVETEWVISVYNVYARSNTFFAYCSIDPVTRQPIAVQVSFVPIIPSLSFNLKF